MEKESNIALNCNLEIFNNISEVVSTKTCHLACVWYDHVTIYHHFLGEVLHLLFWKKYFMFWGLTEKKTNNINVLPEYEEINVSENVY